jgi:hypothetical protein
MKQFNYQKFCHQLLQDLPERTQKVLVRRFGLEDGKKETLEAIGAAYHITRERVRQIEEEGFKKIRESSKKKLQKPLQYFSARLRAWGSFRKEEPLLSFFGGEKFQNHVYFLLALGEQFSRVNETKDFYSLWTTDKKALEAAQGAMGNFIRELEKRNQPLPLPKNLSSSHVEISKRILLGPEGLYGLREWPEINPRSIKNKAYLVLRQKRNPLHFTKIASLIGDLANFQTVHNELIKDSRFVLVGRGIYALKEWGYEPGIVREVIWKTLKEAGRPLPKERIVKKVLCQRLVQENTVLQNLQDKRYFLRTKKGEYTIREA